MTPKPPEVRLARRGDEELLFALVCASDDEWSLGPRDTAKVRDVISLAAAGGAPLARAKRPRSAKNEGAPPDDARRRMAAVGER